MGGSSYSADHYRARSADRARTGTPTFAHDAAVKSGKVAAGVSDKLNIFGKRRESRDSAAHPESLAIAVIFDETGSMGGVPVVLQKKIPELMGLLLRKGYVEHPQILFGAVGDYCNREKAPVQIGQFESGLEMDDCITEIYLEGQGGGGFEESYQDVLYFFGNKTDIDCFEKRGKKGYLFLIGDEKPYPRSTREEIHTIFGDNVQGDITVEEMVAKAQEKYHVFFVIPMNETSHGKDPVLRKRWADLIGNDHVIALQEASAIAELVASTIGICEGTADVAAVSTDLKDIGASDATVGHVLGAVTDLAKSTALAKVGSGDLPGSAGRSEAVTRL